MAQIREYAPTVSATENPLPDPHVPSGANVAEGIQNLGGAIGDVAESIDRVQKGEQEQAQQQEVTDVKVKLMQARAAHTISLQDAASKMQPGDLTFADTYVAAATNDISKMSDDLNITTKAAQREIQLGSADLINDLHVQAAHYQAAGAGVKATQDYLALRDASTNTLVLDPSQFAKVDAQMRSALNDPNGPYARIPADKQAELERSTRETLGQAAVQGIIRQSPQVAIRQLESGQWNEALGADKVQSMLALAQNTEQHNANMAEHALNMQAADQRRAQQTAVHDYTQVYGDGDNKKAQQIFDAMPHDRQVQALKFQKKWDEMAVGDELAHPSNPDAEARLRSGIYAEPNDPARVKDPAQIWDAHNRGEISNAKTQMYVQEWGRVNKQGAAYASAKRNFFSGIGHDFKTTQAIGVKSPAADQQYNAWYQQALGRWDQMERSGESYGEITKSLADEAKVAMPTSNDTLQGILHGIDSSQPAPKAASSGPVEGMTYKDSHGNRARYVGGKYVPVQ